jgi:hypothetical protein
VSIRNPDTLLGWLARGVPVVLTTVIIIGFVLHVRAKLAWYILVVPLLELFALQMVAGVGIFWSRKHYKATGKARPMFLVLGIYFAVLGLMAFHYLIKWHLIANSNDGLWFAIAVLVSTFVGSLLYPHVRPFGPTSK